MVKDEQSRIKRQKNLKNTYQKTHHLLLAPKEFSRYYIFKYFLKSYLIYFMAFWSIFSVFLSLSGLTNRLILNFWNSVKLYHLLKLAA